MRNREAAGLQVRDLWRFLSRGTPLCNGRLRGSPRGAAPDSTLMRSCTALPHLPPSPVHPRSLTPQLCRQVWNLEHVDLPGVFSQSAQRLHQRHRRLRRPRRRYANSCSSLSSPIFHHRKNLGLTKTNQGWVRPGIRRGPASPCPHTPCRSWPIDTTLCAVRLRSARDRDGGAGRGGEGVGPAAKGRAGGVARAKGRGDRTRLLERCVREQVWWGPGECASANLLCVGVHEIYLTAFFH